MKRLLEIQQKLKAPKGQYNSFGGYKYRNCEDILEAVKPYLKEFGLVLLFNDDLLNIGDRYYVKATVSLVDVEKKELIAHTSASAREEETKKGMDGSQITGASSSYARKYALNGLFAIDDTKDSDTTNTHGKEDKKSQKTKATITDADLANALLDEEIEAQMNKVTCADCGAEISEAVASYSYSKFGKNLCMKCQKNNKKLA